MRRLLTIASIVLALALPGRGAPPQAKPSAQGQAKLGAGLEAQIQAAIGAEAGRWGVLAVDLAGGRTVFAHNPDALFVPASNQKVFTTAAALDALGPYWTTRTSVYAGARPGADGVLRGDLVLYGRGDPNLSDRFSAGDPLGPLRLFAARLRDAGVVRVEGDLVADDSYLSGPPHGAGWTLADIQRPFGAEVSALTFNDNLASIYVTPGARGGDPCPVRVVPDVGYVGVVNEITTVAGGPTRVRLRRDLDANRIDLGGTLQAGAREWGVTVGVREPALYTAAAFRRALADAGIEIAGPTRRLGPTSRRPPELELDRLTELASIQSLPLSELVHIVNKESQNLHAELILRMLGRERGPRELPSDEAGLAVIVGFLERIGASAPGMRLHDGSGLSRLDRVSPRMLERVLASLDRHPSAAFFWDSLPDAGVDGTLRHRLGKVSLRAKTGSLEASKSLSGYLATASGDRLAISIVYNDPSGTGDGVPKINRIVTALAGDDARGGATAGPRAAPGPSRESAKPR